MQFDINILVKKLGQNYEFNVSEKQTIKNENLYQIFIK